MLHRHNLNHATARRVHPSSHSFTDRLKKIISPGRLREKQKNKDIPPADFFFFDKSEKLKLCSDLYTSEDYRLLQACLPTMTVVERSMFFSNHCEVIK